MVRIRPRHVASQLHEKPTLQAPTSVLVASLQPCLSAAGEDIARFGEDAVTACGRHTLHLHLHPGGKSDVFIAIASPYMFIISALIALIDSSV